MIDPTAGASSVAGATSQAGSGAASAGSSNGGASSEAGSSAIGGASDSGGADSGGATSTAGQGGTSAAGGTNGTAGSGVAGSTGSAGSGSTAAPIDYSIWVLQLPIGSGTSPTTITAKQLLAGYTSAYFYPSKEDDGQIFMDPQTGITTSGSQHCRTEMRESTTSGGQAAWTSTGTNKMSVEGKVLKVGGGTSGTVTVGQLFIGTDSIPLFELMYNGSGSFKGLYEEAKGGSGGTIDLATKVALNTRYSFSLALTKGKLTVTINGKEVYTRTPSATALGKKFYFKVGNYDQTAKAGAISTTPYTVVEVYKVDVVHQ